MDSSISASGAQQPQLPGLLALPTELLGDIFGTLFTSNGLDQLMLLRLVCPRLDEEIFNTICRLRLLELPQNHYQHENVLFKYLVFRVQHGNFEKHNLTKALRASVDYIVAEIPELQARREGILLLLCRCAVQMSNTNHIKTILSSFRISGSSSRSLRESTSQFNFLEAAAYLGFGSLVRRLLDNIILEPSVKVQHVAHVALQCAIAGGNQNIVEMLLERGCLWDSSTWPKSWINESADLIPGLLQSSYNQRTFRYCVLRTTAVGDLQTFCNIMQGLWQEEPAGGRTRALRDYSESNELADEMLLVAASHGHTKFVQLAIDRGARLDRRLNYMSLGNRGILDDSIILQYTPIEVAARRGHRSVVQLLLDNGVNPNSRALGEAAKGGWLPIVQMMIDAGVKAFPCLCGPNNDQEAVAQVVKRGNIDMFQLFLDNGFDLKNKEETEHIAANLYFFALHENMTRVANMMTAYGFQPKRDWKPFWN